MAKKTTKKKAQKKKAAKKKNGKKEKKKEDIASGHKSDAQAAQEVHERNAFREGYETNGANYEGVHQEENTSARYGEHHEAQAKQKGKEGYDWCPKKTKNVSDYIREGHQRSLRRRGVQEGKLEQTLRRHEHGRRPDPRVHTKKGYLAKTVDTIAKYCSPQTYFK